MRNPSCFAKLCFVSWWVMTHFISEENLKWMIQQCKMFCCLFPPLKVFFPRETPTFSTFRRKRPFSFEPETVDLRGLSKLMWLWHSMSENMQGIWSHIPSVLFHSYVNCVQKFLKILKSDLALSPSLINKPDCALIFCCRGKNVVGVFWLDYRLQQWLFQIFNTLGTVY